MLKNLLQFACILFLFCSCSNKENSSVVEVKKFDYPSASAIEYFEGRLYVMGDDATNLLELDTSLNIIDSIPILFYPGKRIPKDIKPDLETSALNGNELLLIGSGSLGARNFGRKYNLKSKDTDSINLKPLYLKIKEQGIEQINIEGSCFTSGKLILANRGNKGYPHNHFIITNYKFGTNDNSFEISLIPFEVQKDTALFKAISGLCYAKESDQLIMTVSTEDTRNSYIDGAIGNSYLWIINSFSDKLNNNTIGPDKIIDLEEIDPRFKNQKIESATVTSETNERINLVLVADNDDGSSTIFKMSIKKE